jgi:hypothetical protein
MPTTILRDGALINISAISADSAWTDIFTSGQDLTTGPMIDWIMFVPGSANDKMVIKKKTAAGPIGFRALCLTTDEKIVYFHGARFPFIIDFSDCTLNAGHMVIIQLWPREV